MTPRRIGAALAILLAPLALVLGGGDNAQAQNTKPEHVKLGLLKTAGNGGLFVAQDRGYFAAQNLDVELVFFDGALPIAVATVSGDIDLGSTALTAGLYNMAAQGAMRVIAAQSADVPTFQNNTVVVSNQAWDNGLKSYKDLGGKKIGITSIGGSPQYCIVLLSEKYGFPLSGVHFLPLQSVTNIVSAIKGNQADAGVGPAASMLPVVQRGDAKMLGFVGDEAAYQLGGIFVSTKTADNRGDMLKRFLIAYRHGAKDYHDAVTGPGEKRQDGPGTDAMLKILAKYIGQTPEQLKPGISYVDAEVRLDQHDVQHQIDWYKSQGEIKGDLKASVLIDKRYATVLPGKE
ncbi:MAG TPA: ABC transporter substrate-binding protein [Stellaceae bacterium]|jgi:NitT/TauT family transport system substrate-binding protein|nr:ABC transporter substrate-binding protein [Stellaceae bacterium]